jgi:hypothetical protein
MMYGMKKKVWKYRDQVGVVVQPNEADWRLLVQAKVQEGENEGGDDRDEGQRQETDDPGADEQVTPERLSLRERETRRLLRRSLARFELDDAHPRLRS